MQRAHDFEPFEWFALPVLLAQCHESWHFVLGESELFSSVFVFVEVADFEL